MSRRLFRCRNTSCPVQFGATLGVIARSGQLELAEEVSAFAIHLDTRRATIRCPACGRPRDYDGTSIFSRRSRLPIDGGSC